ncbi:hypothetical protein CFOL_v3_03392 [Cephalotus follicularis]|uniref:Uncharacterized protein n=1 Tax=Cephalotus follicularis TaxID=3775 RepID=A0A1Q3AVV0_CEPFO|nr:hypothetical protein CFOL_v3_03392 [Cephalotus follicularis]
MLEGFTSLQHIEERFMMASLLRSLGDWQHCMAMVFGFVLAVFFVLQLSHAEAVSESSIEIFSTTSSRKLLQSDDNGDANRIGKACSKDDIAISQGSIAPLPNGIPAYTVQILNMCVSDCSIYDIHVSCGWFSSVRLINPRIFRRVDYDDCIANDGEALGPGQSLSFQYANSFRYRLSVVSIACI